MLTREDANASVLTALEEATEAIQAAVDADELDADVIAHASGVTAADLANLMLQDIIPLPLLAQVGSSLTDPLELRVVLAPEGSVTVHGTAPVYEDEAPAVTGDPVEDEEITVDFDSTDWESGDTPIETTYQWYTFVTSPDLPADAADGDVIEDATDAAYTIVTGDVDAFLALRITGTNAFGTGTVWSEPTAVITAAP